MKLITCEFNMDSGCVELRFDDGTTLDIDCTIVSASVLTLCGRSRHQGTKKDEVTENERFS